MSKPSWRSVWLAGLGVLLAVPAAAQAPKSADLALALGKKMSAAKLTYLVAPDVEAPDQFVGAFHIPEVELRVVAAQYTAPALLKEHVLKEEHQEAYIELSSGSELESRTFVDDISADGLRADPPKGLAGDTYQVGNTTVTFNKDWKTQELTEAAYKEAFSKAEAEYVRVLTILTGKVGQSQ
ncbi:MAG: hypothetical protein GEV06_17435 [Luteitalea sp.]|nr:hypothetical protein [Luteitalea sp.]